jgi:hypothetical protein
MFHALDSAFRGMLRFGDEPAGPTGNAGELVAPSPAGLAEQRRMPPHQ